MEKNLSTFCPCPESLWENEFKNDILTNPVKEISRQLHIQAVAWLLLATFNNCKVKKKIEQKAELKVFLKINSFLGEETYIKLQPRMVGFLVILLFPKRGMSFKRSRVL